MSALIVLTDEVGQPRESTYEVSDWRRFDAAKLLELVRAAWPGETVLGVEWAAEPRLYSAAGDAVLLVRCDGVDQRREVVRRSRKPKTRRADEEETFLPEMPMLEALEWGAAQAQARKTGADARCFAPAAETARAGGDEVVDACSCGTVHTARAWAALELLGARDVVEGATVIHEDYRRCGCGATRMISTKRLRAA